MGGCTWFTSDRCMYGKSTASPDRTAGWFEKYLVDEHCSILYPVCHNKILKNISDFEVFLKISPNLILWPVPTFCVLPPKVKSFSLFLFPVTPLLVISFCKPHIPGWHSTPTFPQPLYSNRSLLLLILLPQCLHGFSQYPLFLSSSQHIVPSGQFPDWSLLIPSNCFNIKTRIWFILGPP